MGNTDRFKRGLYAAFFSASLIYWEGIFRVFTVGAGLNIGLVYTLLFCVAYGVIGYLLSTLLPDSRVSRVLAALLLTGTSLAYIVQFLIYKQFKQFYDINTMSGGAEDALSSYYAELLDLIFPQGGIFVILLLLLPLAVFLIFCKKLVVAPPATAISRLASAGAGIVSYALALVLILMNPVYGPVYHGQYNFQSAVSHFGLITGLRLDLQDQLVEDSYRFETPELPAQQTEPTQQRTEETTQETTVPTEPVIEYNQLELDFDQLDRAATSQQKELNAYVKGLSASCKNAYTGLFRGKNLIMISAEAFSAEVIDPILTPTLYRLANKGIQFTDYYQPASAGTTGGEYQNIFGMMPTAGGKSFKNTQDHLNYYTIGSQLDRLGYYGKAFHNNSYTYYDRNKTHNNIGYSDGFMGYGNGMEQYVRKSWPQSDYEMFAGTLPTYIDKQPFSVYYMTVSGHSGYSQSGNSMTKKNWERVAHLPYSDTVKGYLAANLELEDALSYLVSQLEERGIAEDTVICISTDHFPYGLDTDGKLGDMPYLSELYGYRVDTYFERDHSRLILWSGCLETMEPVVVDTPTFSLDILPTLSNLFGTEFDSRLLPGRDVFSDAQPLVFNSNYDWKTDLGTYYASSGTFEPASADTVIPEGYVEAVKAIVRNKMTYCSGVLNTDYFRLLFG